MVDGGGGGGGRSGRGGFHIGHGRPSGRGRHSGRGAVVAVVVVVAVVTVVMVVNRELKQRRFWATHVNRKWAFFSFSKPLRYRICIAKCLNSYRDDLLKDLFKITTQVCKKSISGSRASLKNVAA